MDLSTPPPSDGNRFASATWLLARHPRVLGWAARIPGVVTEHADAAAGVDVDVLADVIAAEVEYSRAWVAYEDANPEPGHLPNGDVDDAALDRWERAGPQSATFHPALPAFLPMSTGEKACLRLLATIGFVAVPFHWLHLAKLDGEGHRYLADWCAALQAW